MKRFIPLVAFFFISTFSFAQYENIDLSKYKLPDIKRHQLDFDFNSNGLKRSSVYNNEEGKDDTKQKEFIGNGILGYSYFSNSNNFQKESSITTNLNYSKLKNENYNGVDSENSHLESYINAYYNINYFMGEKQWFLMAHPFMHASFSNEKDFIANTNSKDKGFSGSIALGGGIGRIEQVQDFRHAILLLQELEERGVAKRQLSEDEVLAFSTLISELKNKRVFDARKRKQADLEAIHTYLVEIGVVDEQMDMNYFVGLEDIWEFGGLQTRQSGKRFLLHAAPGYDISKFDDFYGKIEIFDVSAYLVYLISKPISIKWQSDYNFGLNYNYTDKLNEENIYSGVRKHYTQFYSRANIGFFPNTRTSFYANTYLSLFNSSDEKLFDDERYSLVFSFAGSAYYYISERFRIGATLSYQSTMRGLFNAEIEDTRHNYFRYDLKLSYAIF